jgi:hypothetical protein
VAAARLARSSLWGIHGPARLPDPGVAPSTSSADLTLRRAAAARQLIVWIVLIAVCWSACAEATVLPRPLLRPPTDARSAGPGRPRLRLPGRPRRRRRRRHRCRRRSGRGVVGLLGTRRGSGGRRGGGRRAAGLALNRRPRARRGGGLLQRSGAHACACACACRVQFQPIRACVPGYVSPLKRLGSETLRAVRGAWA